ncbi:MAG: phosphatase PAP2 family protein [Candidatus Pacebacteria bacterium]|nr:phosphatase PAP2 family protein [Candidatus Paceibacterota bacterium]
MNQSLFLTINGWAGHRVWLDALMYFCAEYLMYVMILAVVVYVIIDYKRWRDMAIVSVGSALVARFVVASGIRMFYYHARPYWVLAQTHMLITPEKTSSFPSGHTIFVFSLAMAVYQYNKKVGNWFFLAAILVGFSRIFAGAHWPYDIVAGAVLGVLTAIVCVWGFKKYVIKAVR